MAAQTSEQCMFPSILLTNTQSIVAKFDDFESVVRANNIDVACVTESWLNNDILCDTVNIN